MEDTHNFVLLGGPGTGKTHQAAAIGIQAIQHHRLRVRLLSTIELFSFIRKSTKGLKMKRFQYLPIIALLGLLLGGCASQPKAKPGEAYLAIYSVKERVRRVWTDAPILEHLYTFVTEVEEDGQKRTVSMPATMARDYGVGRYILIKPGPVSVRGNHHIGLKSRFYPDHSQTFDLSFTAVEGRCYAVNIDPESINKTFLSRGVDIDFEVFSRRCQE